MRYIEYVKEVMTLCESNMLSQGIFWTMGVDEFDKDYCFQIESNPDGTIVHPDEYNLNAKSGNTFNHEKYWKTLPKRLTHGEEFNYYPRGRVQITNGTAIIYANPNICTDKLKQYIVNQFSLYKCNGINEVRLVADGSEHYKCFLDY